MSEQPDVEAAVSKELPAGAVDLADCGREVRGFVAAAFLPGALAGLAFAIFGLAYVASSALDPKALLILAWTIPYMACGAFFGLIVTVPTILAAGLPAYFLYRRMGWTGWPSHSLGGALIAVIYPYMKRVTYLPQVVLGAAFAWSVPMVFAAQTGSVPQIAWLMFTTTVLWTTAYDTMYAMVDRQDDIALGLKSTAILFDEADRILIGALQLSVLICLCMIGYQAELGIAYYGGVACAALLAVYQQRLIYHRERDGCFKAFLNNNFFGMVVFLGMLLDYKLG